MIHTRGVAADITTTIVRSRDAVARLERDWLDLENAAGHDIFFQSYGWTTSVWDFETSRNNTNFDPLVVLAHVGDQLVAVLPLERINTGLRRLIVPIGFAYSQISNLIIAPDYAPQPIFAAMQTAATKALAADNFLFPKVREDSVLARAMPRDHLLTGEVLGAPIVELDGFEDYPSYLQTIRLKTRKNIRNARNRLEREGELKNIALDSPSERRALIGRTLAWRAERLHEQGLTSRAFGSSHFAQFCDSLVAHQHMTIAAFSYQLCNEPLAEQWGFVHSGRYYCYVTSRDFAHIDESPGKLHLAEIIRSCMDMKLRACDLGVPDMPYKRTWATRTIAIKDYAIPLTLKGKIMCQVWDVFLRPKLKQIVLKTPTPIRAALLGLVARAS